MLAVSFGQLPPVSTTRSKSVQEISTSSSLGDEQGDSQSNSIPLAPDDASHCFADEAKVALAVGEAARALKYADGKFQPPMDRMNERSFFCD